MQAKLFSIHIQKSTPLCLFEYYTKEIGYGSRYYIKMIGNFEKNVCFYFNLSDRQVAGAENE